MILSRTLRPMFVLDANRVNARCALPAMDQIEKWADDGVIRLCWAEQAQLEAEKGSPEQRKKSRRRWIWLDLPDTDEERALIEKIGRIIFGNASLSKSQQNDALIVFNAKKNFGILITDDGGSKRQPRGILGSATDLHRKVGVQVMRDIQAVELIQQLITERDAMAKTCAQAMGLPLPEWHGKDNLPLERP
jgi:hypothetical protein